MILLVVNTYLGLNKKNLKILHVRFIGQTTIYEHNRPIY